MERIALEREIRATPGAVWSVLVDHRGWERWSGAKEVVLRREGVPAPNGVGASRVLRARGLAIEEEILRFDPSERMDYRVSAGLPLRDHRGSIELSASEGGTLVRWQVRFQPRIPGTGPLLRGLLARAVRGTLARLARAVEAQPSEGGS